MRVADQNVCEHRRYAPPAARIGEPSSAAPPTKIYRDAHPGLDDAWPLSFWVVGYLLPPDQGQTIEREFFVWCVLNRLFLRYCFASGLVWSDWWWRMLYSGCCVLVCSYQDDIPQNVAELAYKVNFGLQF